LPTAHPSKIRVRKGKNKEYFNLGLIFRYKKEVKNEKLSDSGDFEIFKILAGQSIRGHIVYLCIMQQQLV
jgi:hypothetical protein